VENGEACLLLEHIAAVLGLDTPAQRPLRDQARDASAFGHIVVHWTGEHGKALDPGALVRKVTRRSHGSRADVLTRPDIRTERGAAVARLTVRDRLTHTGFDLVDPWATLITEWNSSVHSSVTASGEYEKGS
jgi:hypothetical protein